MTQKIKVEIRSVYGRDTVYPACPDAMKFAHIAGTKTLGEHTLSLISDLGYEIEVVQPVYTIKRGG